MLTVTNISFTDIWCCRVFDAACVLYFLGQFSNDPYQTGTFFMKATHLHQPQKRSMFLTQFCPTDHKEQATFYLSHHQKYQLVRVI